jgi:transposase InsO family protein
MKFAFMHEHRLVWRLSMMARVLGVTRQGYHEWAVRQPSKRELRHRDLRLRIRTIYEESNGSYGSPRITSELIEEHGIVVTRKTIEHLMRQEGLSVKPKSRFRPTTDSSKTLAPAPNRLD